MAPDSWGRMGIPITINAGDRPGEAAAAGTRSPGLPFGDAVVCRLMQSAQGT